MRDIFYLLDIDIDSRDICKVLQSNESASIILNKDNSAFTIDYGSQIHTEWYKMDLSEFDDAKFSSDIKIVYCISHHSDCINFLLFELKKLLDEFGGLIGNDSENFEPLYNSNNISKFKYN